MVIRGRVEYADGVTNLVADRLQPLSTVYPQAAGICLPAPVPGLPLARWVAVAVHRGWDRVVARPFGDAGISPNTSRTRPPSHGMQPSSTSHPLKPASCSRRTVTASVGTRIPRQNTPRATMPIGAAGISQWRATPKVNRLHHQYSPRLARP